MQVVSPVHEGMGKRWWRRWTFINLAVTERGSPASWRSRRGEHHPAPAPSAQSQPAVTAGSQGQPASVRAGCCPARGRAKLDIKRRWPPRAARGIITYLYCNVFECDALYFIGSFLRAAGERLSGAAPWWCCCMHGSRPQARRASASHTALANFSGWYGSCG